MGNKKVSRKRGADLGQILIYSTIALVLLMGAMYLRGFLDLRQKQQQSLQGFAQIVAEVKAQRALNGPKDPQLEAKLISSGSIGSNYIANLGGREYFILPYWGLVEIHDDLSSNGFVVSVVYSFPSKEATRICNYLATGPVGTFRDLGLLGENYAIGSASCNAVDYPLFTAVFRN